MKWARKCGNSCKDSGLQGPPTRRTLVRANLMCQIKSNRNWLENAAAYGTHAATTAIITTANLAIAPQKRK